jgi:hypothetical protein
MLSLAMAASSVAAGVVADDGATVQQRCESGGYVDSAASCNRLAAQTSDPAVARLYRLRAARHDLWQCQRSGITTCHEAMATLWAHSEDPAEVTMAAGYLQKVCAEDKRPAACQVAALAAWYGRGVPVDAVATFAWGHRCEHCTSFTPDYVPKELVGPWTNSPPEVRAARIKALAAAGAPFETILALKHERSDGVLAQGVLEQLADEIAAARWRVEIDPLLAKQQWRAALASADMLVERLPSPSVKARRDRLHADLLRRHLDAMKGARAARLPLAERVHAAVARLLGAEVEIPPDATPAWRELPIHPKLTGLDGSCNSLLSDLNNRYPPAAANVEIRAPLACSRVTRKETRIVSKPEWKTITTEKRTKIKGTTEVRSTMCVGGYKRAGESDICSVITTTPDRVEVTTETHKEKVMRDVREEYSVERVVVRGTLEGPIGTATVDGERADGVEVIAEAVDSLIGRVKDAQIEKELAKAKGAPPLVVEEQKLRALTLGRDSDLAGTFGLSGAQLTKLLAERTLPKEHPAEIAWATAPEEAPARVAFEYVASRYPEPKLPAMPEPTPAPTVVEHRDVEKPFTMPSLLPGQTLIGAGALLRSGGMDETRGVGLRAEYGMHLDSTWDLALGVMLAGGYDKTFGASFDGQLAFGTGYKSENVQAIWLAGGGAGKLASRDANGRIVGDAAFDVFHGPDLTIGAESEGLLAHARFFWIYGGSILSGTRITAEVAYRWLAGNELGLALTRNHLATDENILGLGLIYRTAR